MEGFLTYRGVSGYGSTPKPIAEQFLSIRIIICLPVRARDLEERIFFYFGIFYNLELVKPNSGDLNRVLFPQSIDKKAQVVCVIHLAGEAISAGIVFIQSPHLK